MTEQFNYPEENLNAPNKSKSKIVIPAVLLVLVAILGGLFYAYKKGLIGLSSKDKVALATVNMFSKEENKNELIDNYLGVSELLKATKKASSAKGSIELVELPGPKEANMPNLKGLGINFDINSDSSKKALFTDLGLAFKGSKLISAQFLMNENKIEAQVPTLISSVFTANIESDLKNKLKSSMFGKNMTEEDLNNFVLTINNVKKSLAGENGPMDLDFTKYKFLKDSFMKFKDTWVVEKADSKSFNFNGKDESMNGFKYKISKESILTLLKDLQTGIKTDENFKKEVLDEVITTIYPNTNDKTTAYTQLDTDITKTIEKIKNDQKFTEVTGNVYLNSKNQMISLLSKTQYTDGVTNVELQRNGGDFISQNGFVKISATEGGKATAIKVTSTGSTVEKAQSRAFNVTFTEDGKDMDAAKLVYKIDTAKNLITSTLDVNNTVNTNENFKLDLQGSISNLVKGKSMKLIFDKIDASLNNEPVIKLKGDVDINTEKVDIKEISGNKVDIFTLKEEDFSKFIQEFQTNIQKLYQTIFLKFMGN